ncbi:hypothetical protein, partial [Candidatus Avelusimicrobium alvi]|uniref:hypothetical protein n=1 Tax=Candidatus Avelusimicrobium alvi TaxID=3416221 RepID=UPI003D0A7F48
GLAIYGTFRYLGEKHSGMQKLSGSGSFYLHGLQGSLSGGGSLCGHIRLIEPHRLSCVAKQPYKRRKNCRPMLLKSSFTRRVLQLATPLKQVKTFFRLEAFYKQG